MVRYVYEANMRHARHKCLRPAIHAIMDIQYREFGAAEEKAPGIIKSSPLGSAAARTVMVEILNQDKTGGLISNIAMLHFFHARGRTPEAIVTGI